MDIWETGLDMEALLIENELLYLANKYNFDVDYVREVMAEVGNHRIEIEKRLAGAGKGENPG